MHTVRDATAKFIRDYSKNFHDEALKIVNEKITEVSLQVAQFLKELKEYPNACQYLSKQDKLGNPINSIDMKNSRSYRLLPIP